MINIIISKDRILAILIPIFIYFFSIGIYLHPLTSAPTPSESPNSIQQRWKLIYSPQPQLDELHIMSTDNHDITPLPTVTSWTEAWHNDYWGRPLTSESSHKSWRPISIWSFRFGKGGKFGRWIISIVGRAVGSFMEGMLSTVAGGFRSGDAKSHFSNPLEWEGELASELFVHRFVNVCIHAALVQIVGAVATLLFASSSNERSKKLQLYTKYISQVLFAFHPVHVEAVVNVANRPHILALLFNATIVDPNVPLMAMAILGALGLLTAETAIFQFPAIVLTMTAIRYRELVNMENQKDRAAAQEVPSKEEEDDEDEEEMQQQKSPIIQTFISLLPRYVLLVLISVTYLLYRHHNDSLSIPNGLIRPAENPFYNKLDKHQWSLAKRALNYSYILSLHIMKSIGIEIVGYSHEYGFDCIPEMESFLDFRLVLPLTLMFFSVWMIVWSWYGWGTVEGSKRPRQQEREERVQRFLQTLVLFSWMATLFPIAGILKVGTFVADRIAVASSFGTSIFAGRIFAIWIVGSSLRAERVGHADGTPNRSKRRGVASLKVICIFYLCTYELAKRTHNRAAEWMDSVPLLESSLKTCPRSIKSNLEMSKLYSGLVPHMLDLERSLELISTAQSIDPTYCDVHQQYAHVYFQQSKYIPFEEEMVKSLYCQFTMGQAMNNWNKYWKAVLHGGKNKVARERYDKYMARIQEEIAKNEKAEEKKMSSAGVKEEL